MDSSETKGHSFVGDTINREKNIKKKISENKRNQQFLIWNPLIKM